MAEVELKDTAKRVQDLFNRGFGAFERGNLDYAVDMLSECLQLEPRLLQARKFLRAAEIRRFRQKKGQKLAHVTTALAKLPKYLGAMGLIKSRKADRALASAEDLLRADPLSITYMNAFADAALLCELPEAAIQTLEMGREHFPENIELLNRLGALYRDAGETRAAREVFEKLCELRPHDPEAIKSLKDALALDSMVGDGWDEASREGGTYRDMIRDENEAELLEKDQKAVKSEQDTDALIDNTRAKIEAEPSNMNYYRQLGRLYAQRQRFDEAVEVLTEATKISPGDPELDRALSTVKVQRMDHEIAALREAGDEAGAEARANEREQFVFDDLQGRVRRYPNDLRLRYEWGHILYKYDYINEAIQQFQLAQRSPKDRINALYFLAMCFRRKEQYDLALEQLERAASEMVGMNEQKKEILYELASVHEAMGQQDKAIEYFKQIYQVDIGFKDVADKMEQAYKKKPEGE